MTLEELIGGLECKVDGEAGVEVTGIHFDSRLVETGGLFVAIVGGSADGNRFIASAIEKGASAILTDCAEGSVSSVPGSSDVTVVAVTDAREALSMVSSRFYGSPSESLTLVGITGTNGKTTVAYLVESILKEAGFSVGVIGTIDYRYAGRVRMQATQTTPGAVDAAPGLEGDGGRRSYALRNGGLFACP